MPANRRENNHRSFDDLWNSPDFLSAEEKALIELRVQLFGALVEAREQQGMTQTQLAQKANMTQPEIARLERMDANPKVVTFMRAALPLGYKLKLERIE